PRQPCERLALLLGQARRPAHVHAGRLGTANAVAGAGAEQLPLELGSMRCTAYLRLIGIGGHLTVPPTGSPEAVNRLRPPQVGSRTGAPGSSPFGLATFPAPATSHAACGFPALRAPICFAPRLMGPIMLGQLSNRRVALDSR